MDTVEEIREGIEMLEGKLRTRLGRYQALTLEILGARATRKRDWLDEALAELTGLLVEDTEAMQQAMSRVTPEDMSVPAERGDTLLDVARQAKEAYNETRIHELNVEVADMDAQRAAAVREATEIRDALSTWQKRVQELEAVRESLVSDRDHWRTEAEGLRGDLARLRSDFEERLRAVEIHGARRIGGAAEGPTFPPNDNAIQSVIEQFPWNQAPPEPEPDQNHTETIPATPPPADKKRPNWSPESRARQAARMRETNARKQAEREAAKAVAVVETSPVTADTAPSGAVWMVEEVTEPAPVEAVVVVEAMPAPPASGAGEVETPGVFDERTEACRAEIRALYAAGRHFTRDVESDLMARYLLNRHEVTAIREGIMLERAQRGTRLVKCTECHTEFTVEKGSAQKLCADCTAIAAEVIAETSGQAA